ncbi:hypothetical protein [Ralstonia phage phiRSL1]|uniref:Uncharacterized protein n=1 Tax=Ralstonia phage phiRSL1 TaxID=1980924 RepID=B2ZXT6_9CAUD|nr:hypothetical protein RSL1_ORF066 [Ralstonia phage phiRSL1]BAG41512.1 hypothetical protein [Ralstonia phage phiRSL1]
MSSPKHPQQPVVLSNGVARFKENAIICHLFESGKLDLNELARMEFSAEDRMQIAQLLGYSLVGYSDLSYATDESVEAAYKQAKKLK